MQVPPGLFKAYDVRGVYPGQLSEQLVEKIGRAFAIFCAKKLGQSSVKIGVGYDMRTSAPVLSQALIKGLKAQGAQVMNFGLIGTDTAYFASGKLNIPTVMMTASHNPPEWNGLKFSLNEAIPVNENNGLGDIKAMVENDAFQDVPGGQEETYNILPSYVEHMHSMVNIKAIKPMKIAIDAGNGMAGKLAPLVFKGLPLDIVPLYFELDGTFPNHQPSPIEPENVQDLIKKVQEVKADLGMAFDGDADRVYFIDENGGRIHASIIVAMIAKAVLDKQPGAKIIYNVPTSKVVREMVNANGGTAIREKVGHTFIKETMRRVSAAFAGEHSGHFYYEKNWYADSAFITAMIILEMVSKSGRKLSELTKEYQKYYPIEETNSEVADKNATLAKLKEKYADAKMDMLDGVTFEYPDFWFNVRGSNTEPKLRLNLEANTPELRDAKTKEILAIIRE